MKYYTGDKVKLTKALNTHSFLFSYNGAPKVGGVYEVEGVFRGGVSLKDYPVFIADSATFSKGFGAVGEPIYSSDLFELVSREFQVGDVVKCIDDIKLKMGYTYSEKGVIQKDKKYIIIGFLSNKGIILSDYRGYNNGQEAGYSPKKFELVERPVK
jgi:hypothetical protein